MNRSHNDGYFEPEKEVITINELNRKGEYWEGIGYEIMEGRVIR
jgi:hypothetical protein